VINFDFPIEGAAKRIFRTLGLISRRAPCTFCSPVLKFKICMNLYAS